MSVCNRDCLHCTHPDCICDDLVQRLGPIEERAEGLISNTCDHYCVYHITLTTQDELDRQCANCPLAILHYLIYQK